MILYETTVIDMGTEVKAFAEKGMLVTFADKALVTLKDYCYYIEKNSIHGDIKSAGKLTIDGTEYAVTEVGDMVEDNLGTLGHVTILFQEGSSLPGSICVEKAETPVLKKGSRIQIFSE
ncbi:PTS glucitol/sorbitol transporter subunit IIA [Anaerostipes sp.]|uniref:PTS glucitol/sorbitol transporter subunit IIA n=1 Tax=Anaerostipes sp. TaxID=1872530 RepID=UPI0025C187DB|nr:PTS glucitol/sorbitol transporter subunit IIA [Anaerostipes sp.]MBS7007788.1 PTS glucitol/sorbitol transporter subunit IIA [Anaerostipes sp.]